MNTNLLSNIQKKLIRLCRIDLNFRTKLVNSNQLNLGYNEEMEKIHIANAHELEKIIDQIGWPHFKLVGLKAEEAAWIIAQHAISLPDFQRKCLKILKSTEPRNLSSKKYIAYLEDRILCFEGKKQIYGTQFDEFSNTKDQLHAANDLENIDQLRLMMDLPPLKEQIEVHKKRVHHENQKSIDLEKKNIEYQKWLRKVGWRK